jgi:hypothetical protein
MDVEATAYRSICERHVDLLAVYESPNGELALLLDDTVLPPSSPRHRGRWFEHTRSAGERIAAELRRAGIKRRIRVVQLLPRVEAGEILTRWSRRYDRQGVHANP